MGGRSVLGNTGMVISTPCRGVESGRRSHLREAFCRASLRADGLAGTSTNCPRSKRLWRSRALVKGSIFGPDFGTGGSSVTAGAVFDRALRKRVLERPAYRLPLVGCSAGGKQELQSSRWHGVLTPATAQSQRPLPRPANSGWTVALVFPSADAAWRWVLQRMAGRFRMAVLLMNRRLLCCPYR